MFRIILVLAVFLLASCSVFRSGKQVLGIVEGRVVFEKDNRMPGEKMEEATGVKREVCIFKLIHMGGAYSSIIPFEKIKGNPLKTITTDDNGNFKIRLEEGKYSLLIKEKEGYFVPLFDKENNLNPIIVERGKINLGAYVINYAAFY